MMISEIMESRKKLFVRLYQEVFPQFAAFVSKRGGSFEDARDVFQDALIIHYEYSLSQKHHRADGAYLFGIARHLWFKRYKENKTAPVALDSILEIADVEAQEQPSKSRLLAFLEKAGQKCMDLLKAVYYDQMPMRQVSAIFGYGSERSATVQKYKCMEKVREEVKKKKLTYEDFIA